MARVTVKHPRPTVVMLPGFGGSAEQPVLVKLEAALAPEFSCARLAPPRFKLTPDLELWVDWLETATDQYESLILVGRSFGGRLAVRLAQRRKVEALVLLGFPIRPPQKRREPDERALAAVNVPLLVVQGTEDELGPLDVLREHLPREAQLERLEGAGHELSGKHATRAIDLSAAWLRSQPGGQRRVANRLALKPRRR